MQDLKVIGVESGALLVATDAGSEYRLRVTGTLQSQLRAADPERAVTPHKVPPREIQALVRSGRSAEQVAAETGVELDYVRRFEGPVLAERTYVLESARRVPVSLAGDGVAQGETSTFGSVIDARLDAAEATERDWTSYKDAVEGWVVHVSYTTQEVERDATWRFDPKKHALAPLNGDAHTLSRHGSAHTPLVPRLRAVGDAGRIAGEAGPNDSGRFDSGAFEVEQEARETTIPGDSGETSDRSREGRSQASVAAVNRAPEPQAEHNQTADLLEALRRRRGEREAARFDDDPSDHSRAAHPSTGSLRVVDVPLDDIDVPTEPEPARTTKPLATHPTASRQSAPRSDDESTDTAPKAPQRSARARKGRASMPSWDEIVFGARSDDDPA
ncbi:hypothetical protein AS850_07955 [Frondihabitans sp. 762G35]|uniref:septation protein SepH n=1 Tax=Frondihabitans sp. 762G35 TaxID=1446794 RepID=UPI000D21BE01|nr:septation protein SepH [Frondihabitans sp. 762G35]ARC57007.1 hypothetical protein AS850_07955 [Frondihabitans sp. 762G35]